MEAKQMMTMLKNGIIITSSDESSDNEAIQNFLNCRKTVE